MASCGRRYKTLVHFVSCFQPTNTSLDFRLQLVIHVVRKIEFVEAELVSSETSLVYLKIDRNPKKYNSEIKRIKSSKFHSPSQPNLRNGQQPPAAMWLQSSRTIAKTCAVRRWHAAVRRIFHRSRGMESFNWHAEFRIGRDRWRCHTDWHGRHAHRHIPRIHIVRIERNHIPRNDGHNSESRFGFARWQYVSTMDGKCSSRGRKIHHFGGPFLLLEPFTRNRSKRTRNHRDYSGRWRPPNVVVARKQMVCGSIRRTFFGNSGATRNILPTEVIHDARIHGVFPAKSTFVTIGAIARFSV